MIENLIEERAWSKSIWSKILDYWLILLTIILMFVLCITVFFELCQVTGESMLYTLKDKSYIICTAPKGLKRGDIVMAKAVDHDLGDTRNIIKRIVACPGDKIVFVRKNEVFSRDVKLYVAGDDGNFYRQDEQYIRDGSMTTKCFTEYMFEIGEYRLFEYESLSDSISEEEIDESYIISLGENEYFLLGDNRDNSNDSRYYGKFDKKDFTGKLMMKIDGGPLYYILDTLYFVSSLFRKMPN